MDNLWRCHKSEERTRCTEDKETTTCTNRGAKRQLDAPICKETTRCTKPWRTTMHQAAKANFAPSRKGRLCTKPQSTKPQRMTMRCTNSQRCTNCGARDHEMHLSAKRPRDALITEEIMHWSGHKETRCTNGQETKTCTDRQEMMILNNEWPQMINGTTSHLWNHFWHNCCYIKTSVSHAKNHCR